MKGKTFLILLVAAAILAGLAALRCGDGKQAESKMGEKLFVDLPINEVAEVAIRNKDNQVTLIKGETVWQVQERDGYPADFGELRSMVVKLSKLKSGRSFSGSPDTLARLALYAPSSKDAKNSGTQITLKDASGEILVDSILGNTRKSDGGGAGGQYMKHVDAGTVFLVDGDFQFLKTTPPDWLQKDILNIKAENIASVICYADVDDKPVFTLARAEKGKTVTLTPVPEGRTADTAKIDQVFDALAPLRLDDVSLAGDLSSAPDSNNLRLLYQLYDGRQITVIPGTNDNGQHTLRIIAAEGPKETGAGPSGEQTNPDDNADKDMSADEKESSKAENNVDTESPAKTVEELNQALKPWLFIVKEWQFSSFITELESLLEDIKAEGGGEGTS
jgi:hypothetical protein